MLLSRGVYVSITKVERMAQLTAASMHARSLVAVALGLGRGSCQMGETSGPDVDHNLSS